jgi:hypothetical protein
MEANPEQPLELGGHRLSPYEFVHKMRENKKGARLPVIALWHPGVAACLAKEEKQKPTKGGE